MQERTLVLIKPDITGDFYKFVEILQAYAEAVKTYELTIEQFDMFRISDEAAFLFYEEHEEAEYFEPLIKFMTSGKIFSMIISGNDAIKKIRDLNGATNPANAKEGTLRRRFGTPNGGPRNAVHASDSPESASHEIHVIYCLHLGLF